MIIAVSHSVGESVRY